MTEKKYQENLAMANARGEKVSAKAEAVLAQLPLWPASACGVPNPVLRGALFSVSNVRKTHKKRTLIASTGAYEVRFKGECFNQTDLDTLQGMLHLAMPYPLGMRVEFSVHSFLKDIGRKVSGEQHEQFKEQVARLMGGVIEITDVKCRKTFMGALVSKAARDEASGRYVVVFNEEMLQLYQSGYTLIDWAERQALGKNNLAKWLHAFYASHASPYDYKVETLRTLCGSDVERLGDFRKLLRIGLDKLVAVGAIKSWHIGALTDLVTVVNIPTSTQRKYLAKSVSRLK